MNLNYILYRQQIEMMRADRAACAPSRAAHLEMATRYLMELRRYAERPSVS